MMNDKLCINPLHFSCCHMLCDICNVYFSFLMVGSELIFFTIITIFNSLFFFFYFVYSVQGCFKRGWVSEKRTHQETGYKNTQKFNRSHVQFLYCTDWYTSKCKLKICVELCFNFYQSFPFLKFTCICRSTFLWISVFHCHWGLYR